MRAWGQHTRYRKLACTLPKATVLCRSTDLLISIATIIAVGGGDIMKIDCHKKATVQQKEGDCNGGVSQSVTVQCRDEALA